MKIIIIINKVNSLCWRQLMVGRKDGAVRKTLLEAEEDGSTRLSSVAVDSRNK